MRRYTLFAGFLVFVFAQTSFAQVSAEVWFDNKTESTLTIRCFSKRLDLAGFSAKVVAGEKVGTPDLATGDQVIGVWSSDQVTSTVMQFSPGSLSTVKIVMRNGKLSVEPSVVQLTTQQQLNRIPSHFHSKEWQTLCQANDGFSYPVSIDFANRTYRTQGYVGRFSNMAFGESEERWKVSGLSLIHI